ncbi:MAG: trypsin-like peptidase domain-containing protein [Chloroflexi bacterium]|nr:trypsin-like peptidase domain-containing protein [Chloroflexota bacterium]
MRNLPKTQRRLWLISVLLLIALGVGLLNLLPAPSQAQEDDNPPLVRLNEENIKEATVFIMQTVDTASGPVITCVGTGTLVSADGLVLTNAHIVEATTSCPADRTVIALTLRTDEPPVATYTAEIIEFNRGYDLAVLRITRYLDGRTVERGVLQLPFVELGDSNTVSIDDTIAVFGYPDIGNDPIKVIRGTIGGFTAEAGLGERAWLRTTSEIPGLMSGGGVYNRNGELIGVPTIAPAHAGGEALECPQVYDTNADAQIDNLDLCIPLGGTISAIRPSSLARGLVRAAALGIQPGPEKAPVDLAPPADPPTFRRLFVSTGVNEAGMPTNVVTSLPTGTNSLYLFFDFKNMQNGQIYELRTTVGGRPNVLYSLPPVTWSGGERGLWYIGGTVPTGWENGVYEFTLFIEGRQVDSHRITVGGGPRTDPQFSDLVFGIQDPLGNLTGANYIIPEGNIIRARFNYQNMRDGLNWQQRWYQNGDLISIPPTTSNLSGWGGGSSGSSSDPSIVSETGFPSDQYRLELYVQLPAGEDWCLVRPDISPDLGDWCLMVTSDFVIAGGAGGANNAQALIFSDFRFARDEQGGLPISIVAESMPAGSPAIYVFFNWRQVRPGTPFRWRWLVDNEVLVENRTQWATDVNGENYYFSLLGIPNLPDATYRFELYMGGIRLTDETVQVEVGLGQLPVEAFASAEGIQMTGQIFDAATGQGIPGALFVVLLAEFSVEDFQWQAVQVLGRATTDQKGFFQIPALLPRGTLDEPNLYSVIIRAEGYLPVSSDGITVTTETESPINLVVQLSRDLTSYGETP